MTEPKPQWNAIAIKPPAFWRVLELALFLRLLAALGVEWLVRRRGGMRVCLFDDAEYYWMLASTLRQGTPYQVVEWGDIPHFALRTPGYPAFLAACQAAFGDRPFAARLVQAGLGALTVWLVLRLTREVLGNATEPAGGVRFWTLPLLAALLAAIHPYLVVMSALVLSEAAFVPLMLAALWGMAVVWNRTETDSKAVAGRRRTCGIALGTGAVCGMAILVRPSWALFVPGMLAVWAVTVLRSGESSLRSRLLAIIRTGLMLVLGLVLVLSPWWIRNERVFGSFVPTAVWLGASLYDGLNPRATGGSDMKFLEDPELWPLDEIDQDHELTRRALRFVRNDPGRALKLAWVKLGRFWSPWPNAEGFRSPVLAVLCALTVIPAMVAAGFGLWLRRHDARAWVLLAGPVLYFCALHTVFASSMRYRVPGEPPALGLAALGMIAITRRLSG